MADAPNTPPGFFVRLKQHHIYRVAAWYGATIAILIQVVARAFPYFGWSVAVPAVIIILIAGFPVAIVLAWLLVKPTDPASQTVWQKRHWQLGAVVIPIVIAAVVVSGIFAFRFSEQRAENVASVQVTAKTAAIPAPANTSAPSPATVIPAKSVAVLPFESLSADKANAYFADGMQDLILTKLADIGDLKVTSRTSTESYGSHPDDLKTIGQQLGVATILEGSVQKAGNQVLINVQLINAQTDNHIWAQSYQRTLDNIFGVEGEVAQKVASALDAKLTHAETAAVARVGTHNPTALDAFLKARYDLDDSNRTGDAAELARAVPLLKNAIEADPNYADAYALLALAYQKLGGHKQEATAAAKSALQIDPDNADAHTEYAFALADQGKFDAAIAEARKAVALPTHAANNLNGLGVTLLDAGRVEEAEQVFQRSIKADPRVGYPRQLAALTAAIQRNYSSARDSLRPVVASDPGNATAVAQLAHIESLGFGNLGTAREVLQSAATPVASSGVLSRAWFELDFVARDWPAALAVIENAPSTTFDEQPRALYEAQIYRAQGDKTEARAAFALARDQLQAKLKTAPDNPILHGMLAQSLAGLGNGSAALAEAKRAVQLVPIAFRYRGTSAALANQASVEAQVGRADDAIALLEKLMAMPAGWDLSVEDLRLNPEWDPLRNNPHFQTLLKKYEPAVPLASSTVPPAATLQ